MNFKPIGTQVLVEYEEHKPASGILIPTNMESFDYSMFIVRAVGDGFLTTTGMVKPLPIKAGDRIKLKASAMGNLHPLEAHLCEDRKMAVVEISHVMGVWEGELPQPKLRAKITKTAAEQILVA